MGYITILIVGFYLATNIYDILRSTIRELLRRHQIKKAIRYHNLKRDVRREMFKKSVEKRRVAYISSSERSEKSVLHNEMKVNNVLDPEIDIILTQEKFDERQNFVKKKVYPQLKL